MQRSVLSTLQMLELIAHSPEGLTMREIGPLCSEVSTATIYRILKTLSTEGFVVQDRDTKRYRISLRLWQLGAAALNQNHARDVAAPFAVDLARQVRMPVGLALEEGDDMVFSEQFELHDERVVSKPVVLRIPKLTTAAGRVFLAHQRVPDADLRALAARLRRFTERTITGADLLVKKVHEAGRLGYAVTLGEYWPNSGAIAAAACDFTGRPRIAVSLSLKLGDYPDGRAINDLVARVWSPLLDCVERVSAQLGYRSAPALS
ncbi:MAG: IclR family transcriptional regulator [Dehalococcoidia bacterium]